MKTLGDLGAFAAQEEDALAACDARRAAVVAIVDGAGQAQAPKPWWKP